MDIFLLALDEASSAEAWRRRLSAVAGTSEISISKTTFASLITRTGLAVGQAEAFSRTTRFAAC